MARGAPHIALFEALSSVTTRTLNSPVQLQSLHALLEGTSFVPQRAALTGTTDARHEINEALTGLVSKVSQALGLEEHFEEIRKYSLIIDIQSTAILDEKTEESIFFAEDKLINISHGANVESSDKGYEHIDLIKDNKMDKLNQINALCYPRVTIGRMFFPRHYICIISGFRKINEYYRNTHDHEGTLKILHEKGIDFSPSRYVGYVSVPVSFIIAGTNQWALELYYWTESMIIDYNWTEIDMDSEWGFHDVWIHDGNEIIIVKEPYSRNISIEIDDDGHWCSCYSQFEMEFQMADDQLFIDGFDYELTRVAPCDTRRYWHLLLSPCITVEEVKDSAFGGYSHKNLPDGTSAPVFAPFFDCPSRMTPAPDLSVGAALLRGIAFGQGDNTLYERILKQCSQWPKQFEAFRRNEDLKYRQAMQAFRDQKPPK